MYNVFATGSAVILFYFLSYFFCRSGFYSFQAHRKLWNLLLAAFFISSAITGIFLALQINYKWNIPVIKSILQWHVESGIGMAFTGIIHLLLHLSYFKKIFEKSEKQPANVLSTEVGGSRIKVNLFVIGFVSSSVQLLLIREMINIAGGYEFITGTFLGSWLIGSAIGASLAGHSPLNDIKKINIIFSLSPVFSVLLMIVLSSLYFSTGVTPSFLESFIFTLIVLMPFCMVSGFSFVKLISLAASADGAPPGASFSIETAGGVVSGIVISILTSGLLNTYQILLLVMSAYFFYVVVTYYSAGKTINGLATGIFISTVILILAFNPDIFFRQQLLRGVKVTGTHDTPYGNITEGSYEGEVSLYYDHRLLTYRNDDIEREEDIHYAMLQSNSPENVLIISGDISSRLPEIMKYPVKKVVFVERDPELTSMIPDFASSDILKIETKDAYRHIRNSSDTFDVIILLLPPPSTLLLNRYYTTEFFSEIKKKLGAKGIFMCSPGPETNYLNTEVLFLYSSIYKSLSAVFNNILPVAGEKLYFLASDSKLSTSICQLTVERKIRNNYVSSDYLADDLITARSNEIISLIDLNASHNRSMKPVACFHYQTFRMSRNKDEKTITIVLLFMVFAAPAVAVRRKNMIMYSSAAALAGFEIIVLLLLQLTAGSMYQLTGLVIAALMAGLATGAGVNLRVIENIPAGIRAGISIIFYIIAGLSVSSLLMVNNIPATVMIIVIFSFVPAFLTGQIFRFLSRGKQSNQVASLYSSDLTGSALGFFLISGVAIPLMGITTSIFLLSGMIFAGFLLGTVGNK
jgi:spermidine synthase